MSSNSDAFSPQHLYDALATLGTGRRLWIAYSGGLDSHVLLHAAAALRPRLDRELRAVHVDHGLHADSARWGAHCRAVCAGLQVPLDELPLRLQPRAGESLEAVARAARYRALSSLLSGGDALATAHHRDDQAETVLLALLRGSGVHGLAGTAARAPLGKGELIRPLLAHSRADLMAYAQRMGLAWIEDPSNTDTRFDRNFLRREVLPLLRTHWPGADKTLARAASHCADAARLLDEEGDAQLAAARGSRPGTLSVAALRRCTAAARRRLLRRWLAVEGFRAPSSERLAHIAKDCLSAAPDRRPMVAWGGCEVRRYRDDLYALPALAQAPSPAMVIGWDGRGPLALPGSLGRLIPGNLAKGQPDTALAVRFGAAGLRCRAAAGSRPLKHLYQEAGVPPWLRPYVPLVLRDGALCAVGGVSACEDACEGLRWLGHPWMRFDLLRG
jgi:tRNA(Ile)-lysidine synthase